jgi:hypothetical protein
MKYSWSGKAFSCTCIKFLSGFSPSLFPLGFAATLKLKCHLSQNTRRKFSNILDVKLEVRHDNTLSYLRPRKQQNVA